TINMPSPSPTHHSVHGQASEPATPLLSTHAPRNAVTAFDTSTAPPVNTNTARRLESRTRGPKRHVTTQAASRLSVLLATAAARANAGVAPESRSDAVPPTKAPTSNAAQCRRSLRRSNPRMTPLGGQSVTMPCGIAKANPNRALAKYASAASTARTRVCIQINLRLAGRSGADNSVSTYQRSQVFSLSDYNCPRLTAAERSRLEPRGSDDRPQRVAHIGRVPVHTRVALRADLMGHDIRFDATVLSHHRPRRRYDHRDSRRPRHGSRIDLRRFQSARRTPHRDLL